MQNQEEFNKLSFRRMILVLAFISILIFLIPSIFNFEKYYGLSRFVDQGIISSYLDNKFELYLKVFMSIFSLTSFILIYFFVPLGNHIFLVYLIFNFILIMFGGDQINYGYLYPLEWFKNVLEAFLLYWMFFGNVKNHFNFKKNTSKI